MKPLVSIIIVNWNGGEVFGNCLTSLSKIDYPNWELIVVDNGSSDGSLQKLQEVKIPKLHIIKNKVNVGFAPANNQGYKKARGKYILLLNNDTEVTPTFLSKLVDRMEQDISIGVVQPKIFMMRRPGHLDNAGSFLTRIGFLEHWGFGRKDGPEFDKEREIFSAKGACMLIQRRVIEEVGLFDKDFVSYFEESDFCWRVWLAGYKVLYFPKTNIDHRIGYTIRRLDVAQINYDYYKNRINSLVKNLEFPNLITILPAHLFSSVGIAILFLARRQSQSFIMIIKAIFWNVGRLPKTLRKRKQIQNTRKISDHELFLKLMKRVDWKKFYLDFKRVKKDIERKATKA